MGTDLKPCPFCGVAGDADHTEDCYFTVMDKIRDKPSSGMDDHKAAVSAWNRRAAAMPEGGQ